MNKNFALLIKIKTPLSTSSGLNIYLHNLHRSLTLTITHPKVSNNFLSASEQKRNENYFTIF